MNSKRKLLAASHLYAVIDKDVATGHCLVKPAAEVTRAGADIVQLRDKHSNRNVILQEALRVKKVISKKHALLLINDYIDIAQIVDSDGVHLGQDDLPLQAVRKLLGKEKIIGISCHSFAQALKAEKDGADYISIGPVFSTPTKPEYRPVGLALVTRCQRSIKIPWFAIGGIDLKNASRVVHHGAQRVAVCRALCKARNKDTTVSEFRKILTL